MITPQDDHSFTERIDEQLRALAALRAGGTDGSGDPVEAVGESADGGVRVTARSGRVSAITLEPRLLRQAPTELAALFTEAVNAAFEALRARAPAATDPMPDMDALLGGLREVEDQSSRMLQMLSSALTEAMSKVGDRTGLRGDPGPQGASHLFAEATDMLRTARAALDVPEESEPPTGTGSDPDGVVTATVDAAAKVTGLELAARSVRLSSFDLADAVLAAVNAALDALDGRRREARGLDGLDQLAGRARELQNLSVEHMRRYTGNLTDIMGSIREP
ncbi:YbaB/EbfC family nucleoid-associated protein [Longispora urticae]